MEVENWMGHTWVSGMLIGYFLAWVVIIQMSSLYDKALSRTFMICVLILICYTSI